MQQPPSIDPSIHRSNADGQGVDGQRPPVKIVEARLSPTSKGPVINESNQEQSYTANSSRGFARGHPSQGANVASFSATNPPANHPGGNVFQHSVANAHATP